MSRSNRKNSSRLTNRERKRNIEDQLQNLERNQISKVEYEMNRPRFGPLNPRGENQAKALEIMNNSRLVFLTGPAGTGKSFLSTSWAVEQFLLRKVEKIVITRPMVGCDEEIGFLPGTEQEKFAGWIGPFIDVMEGKMGKKAVETQFNIGKFIAKPLMMMRGSTFRDSIVLLDEAQNTTPSQIKMFLTRIGEGTRVIINGDVEQSDLPKGARNGLQDALALFKNSRHASIFEFKEHDITRDPLVREIVNIYRSRNK
jgi:phosphate starvation-inducible PhoH-like protein